MRTKLDIFSKDLKDIFAEEIMSTEIVTVNMNDSFDELLKTFVEKKISGVPVLDDFGELVGIVSKSDFVAFSLERELKEVLKKVVDIIFDDDFSEEDHNNVTKFIGRKVKNIMTKNVVTANPKTSLDKIIKLMRDNTIHRIIITDSNKVVGIVTAMDILNLFTE